MARANTCTGAGKYAKPLIVDLDQDSRATLEASMKKGVVVVAYDCASLRVLPSCRLPEGNYEYAGVSRKEEVIQMKSEDDIHGTLPISAVKVSAEMKSGRSIDLALIRVGIRATSIATVSRADLKGGCDGATHFVQSATLGAYSMATGSVGKVGAVAEMFNVGASSESERKAMNKDGLLEDCKKSDPDAGAPPTECRAPLQVDLQPLVGEAAVAAKPANGEAKPAEAKPAEAKPAKPSKEDTRAASEVMNPCPEGFVFAEGICSRSSSAPKLCDPTNESECAAQCDKGSAESCLALGNVMKKTKRRPQAMTPFKKSCDLGNADGCGSLADLMDPQDDGPSVTDEARAALVYAEKGCRDGSGFACEVAGDYLSRSFYKIRETVAGLKAYERGCTLKRGSACFEAAEIHAKGGKGVSRDIPRAVKLLARACQAGDALQCTELGKATLTGKAFGVTSDEFKVPGLARLAYRRGCVIDTDWCEDGIKMMSREGDFDEMNALATHGCNSGDDASCSLLGKAYEEGKGVTSDPAKANQLYTKACRDGLGDTYACGKLNVPVKRGN